MATDAVAGNLLLLAALEYAGAGWHVVPLHNPTDGGCSCGKSTCPPQSRGKHPRLPEWQNKCSADEEVVAAWWEKWPAANVGVQLGPRSGIIDVEFDDAEGEKTAAELLGECFTPSFRSGRSVHRLFRWTDDLSHLQNVVKRYGLEFRLGTSGGTQSVFPPSRHHSGTVYQWLDGLRPGQVDVVAMPNRLVALLYNDAEGEALRPANGKAARKPPEHWEAIISGVAEGGRNESMASLIGYQLALVPNLEDTDAIAVQWALATAANERNKPPLAESELRGIFASILKREEKRRSDADYHQSFPRRPEDRIEDACEKAKADKKFQGWRLVIVKGDPQQYRLYAPIFARAPGGYLMLTSAQLCNAEAIRVQALEQADFPLGKPFAKSWHGRDSLYERLVLLAETISAPLEQHRRRWIARQLVELLTRARPLRDGEKPSGVRPARLDSGEVVFSFRSVLEDLSRTDDKVKRTELSQILESVGSTWFHPTADVKLKMLDKDSEKLLRELAEWNEVP